MMTIDEMKKRKEDLLYTYEMIAEKSGLPLSTVQKVLCGVTKKPRLETMEALEMVLKKPVRWYYGNAGTETADEVREGTEEFEVMSGTFEKTAKVRSSDICRVDRWAPAVEPSERWPRQGEYTAADYYALPDDMRVELIDGYIYDLACPTDTHQFLQFELGKAFSNCIEKHGRHCAVFLAPLDVAVDGDDKTIVQPDILIRCERDEEDEHYTEVPEMVIEILSPSTRDRDCTIKLRKYMNAGVREYWMVDPDNEKVIVYVFDHDLLPDQYSFDDEIPVGISGGECSVDFGSIRGRLHEARKWNILH